MSDIEVEYTWQNTQQSKMEDIMHSKLGTLPGATSKPFEKSEKATSQKISKSEKASTTKKG